MNISVRVILFLLSVSFVAHFAAADDDTDTGQYGGNSDSDEVGKGTFFTRTNDSEEDENEEENDEDDDEAGGYSNSVTNMRQGRSFCVKHEDRSVNLYCNLCSIHKLPNEYIRIYPEVNRRCRRIHTCVRSPNPQLNSLQPENVHPSQFVCGVKNGTLGWYCSYCALELDGATLIKPKRTAHRCKDLYKETCKPSPGGMIPVTSPTGSPATDDEPLRTGPASDGEATGTAPSGTWPPGADSPLPTSSPTTGATDAVVTAPSTGAPTTVPPPPSTGAPTTVPPPPSTGAPTTVPTPPSTGAPTTFPPPPAPRDFFPPLQRYCIAGSQGTYSCPCPADVQPPTLNFKMPSILKRNSPSD